MPALPSKDMILQAFAGSVALPHPVLQAAYELASLHEARLDPGADLGAIDRERARLVCRVDSWVSAVMPPAFDAAYLHTETVGVVIDRLAKLSVDAHAAAEQNTPTVQYRHAQLRLEELALAYGDLCFEVVAGTRRLPACFWPVAEGDSAESPDV
ncbi:DUF4254 domain-containing protein [Nocardia brasiliensis]|uniref:DUF4254 domain-containing protein n=1 Tax=Nocardia brasiliensis TaxID=37326 RepID=UPI0024569BA1|nr:DUF4254 domain-containing protein [Nocardia brasiliensis]